MKRPDLVLRMIFPCALLGATAVHADPLPPIPKTTVDPKIPTASLDLLTRPLTKAELIVEADAWQKLLQAKAMELSRAEVAAGTATGDEKSKLLEKAAQFRNERTQVIDRMNVVLAALKAKGGAIADYETYINAVSGITVDVTDAQATYTTLINWLTSAEGGIRYGKNIVLFLLTLLVFKVISSIVGRITTRAMSSVKNVSNLLRDFVINVVRKVTFFVGFVIALSMLEVNIGPFLAAMGAVGFVIGFALQGTLSNFAAGVMILLYRPYDLEDSVTVAGVTGKVKAMTLVSTLILNNDGHSVTIPNSSIWGGTITRLAATKA